MGQEDHRMPNQRYRFSDGPSSVERACEITKNLFNAARGNYATDTETVTAIARKAQLSPAAVRRFLQPSRRPKDVSLGVWGKLLAAYRGYLERQLATLQAEIHRLEHLDPSDGAILDLLDDAKALVIKIEMAARALPPSRAD